MRAFRELQSQTAAILEEAGQIERAIELLLSANEPLDALAEQRLGVLLVDRQAAAFGRVMIGQTELARFVDAKLFGEFGELHEMFS